MKIEHLQYFVALATSSTHSITKVAEELFISQQQLNRIISALEEDVNCKLITRSTKGITLTDNGKQFLKYANNILKEYSAMTHYFYMQSTSESQDISSEIAKVKISLPATLSIYSNEIIKRLKILAPNIPLTIEENNTLPVDNLKNILYFWVLDLPDNTNKHQNMLLDDVLVYLAYRKDRYLNKEVSLEKKSDLFLSHADYSDVNPDDIVMISNNIDNLIEIILESDMTFGIPDFCIPKLTDKYPEIGFRLISEEKLKLNVIFPSAYTLTEADKVVINFMQSYIRNLQLLAHQI